MNRENHVFPGISILLFLSHPSYVAGPIISVSVYSINCEAIGALSNVLVKHFKRISPLRTNAYAPASIPPVRLVSFVRAALNHIAPNVVSPAVFLAVLLWSWIALDARFTDAHSEAAIVHCEGPVATGAKTQASGSGFSAGKTGGRSIGNNSPLAKLHSNEGYFLSHDNGAFVVMISSGRPATTGARCDSASIV